MLKVVELKPKGAQRRRILVELLEDELAEVRRGKVVGVAVVMVYENGDNYSSYQGDALTLLGAAARLTASINNDMDENR